MEMDNAHFAKFAKETGLVHRKGRLTVTDVDLIFSQVKTKGQRKIKYTQFESALELIGACAGHRHYRACVWVRAVFEAVRR